MSLIYNTKNTDNNNNNNQQYHNNIIIVGIHTENWRSSSGEPRGIRFDLSINSINRI